MYTVKFSSTFKKDYKRMTKQGKDMSLLDAVIDTLRLGKKLDRKYNDHALTGLTRLNFRALSGVVSGQSSSNTIGIVLARSSSFFSELVSSELSHLIVISIKRSFRIS